MEECGACRSPEEKKNLLTRFSRLCSFTEKVELHTIQPDDTTMHENFPHNFLPPPSHNIHILKAKQVNCGQFDMIYTYFVALSSNPSTVSCKLASDTMLGYLWLSRPVALVIHCQGFSLASHNLASSCRLTCL